MQDMPPPTRIVVNLSCTAIELHTPSMFQVEFEVEFDVAATGNIAVAVSDAAIQPPTKFALVND